MSPEEFGIEPGDFVDVWTVGGTRFQAVKVTDTQYSQAVVFSDEGHPLIVKTEAIAAISRIG